MSWFLIAALLYPSVVKTDANLFKEEKWKSRVDVADRTQYRWEKSKGGPFSPDEPVWKTTSLTPKSSFWRQDVKLKTGHRYLVGAWVRRDLANALLWCYGRTAKDKPYNYRVYLFGGFNRCLESYLRPEMKKKLGGDPDAWHLLYRPIEVTEDLAFPVQFKFGIFMSTGSVEISHPFLIDITGKDRIPLVVEHKGGKPVSRMSVEHVGLRDVQWTKTFPKPVTEFSEVLEITDSFRGFDNAKRIDGNMLSVTYADGTAENVYAPQENAFLVR